MRFWTSWWHGAYEDEGYTKPPFEYWISGYRFRPNEGMTDKQYEKYCSIENEKKQSAYFDKYSKNDASICAVIDATSEEEIRTEVEKYFPGCEWRFINEKEEGFDPSVGGRFNNFNNEKSLYKK